MLLARGIHIKPWRNRRGLEEKDFEAQMGLAMGQGKGIQVIPDWPTKQGCESQNWNHITSLRFIFRLCFHKFGTHLKLWRENMVGMTLPWQTTFPRSRLYRLQNIIKKKHVQVAMLISSHTTINVHVYINKPILSHVDFHLRGKRRAIPKSMSHCWVPCHHLFCASIHGRCLCLQSPRTTKIPVAKGSSGMTLKAISKFQNKWYE